MLDAVIRGGRVVDGSGAPWVRADVGIAGGKIAAVGDLSAAAAATAIDATGKIVAPGFIDCHSHSDWSLLANRDCDSTLAQGVTTEVVGNCGMSYAPVGPLNRERVETDVARTSPGAAVAWTTFGEYLDHVRAGGIGANYAFLVGHAAIRTAVIGSEEREARPDEVAQMERLLAQALEEGAAGFSTGLEFVPGRVATVDELVALSRVVAAAGKLHTSHQRTRNERFVESVQEILGVCETAGARLQISHNNKRLGAPDGAWETTMDLQEAARRRGLDVSCDTTSYIAGLGIMAAVLPPWLFDAGPAEAARRLGDRTIRRKVKGDCRRYWLMIADGLWDRVRLGRTTNSDEYFGRTFAELGEALRKDPMDVYLDVLMNEGAGIADAGMFGEVKSPEHLKELMQHPLVSLEADAWTASAEGPLAPLVNHPASFGWTARILGEYVREGGWLRLEEAIKKMTAMPAAKFGLRDRGLLRPGLAADVVVFDAETVADNASFERPAVYPSGIEHVFVNGTAAVRDGALRRARTGVVLSPA
ncbi:MAG TPA: D-aminoacylase [Chloroflexota bacterium]|nr:D-aminoacylase [Chloroflexota bacterium]